MNVVTQPPAWREFPSGLVPAADGPIQCVRCERPAQLYVLDLREDMWFSCLDHHAALVLDLLSGNLDDEQPPEVSQSEQPGTDRPDQAAEERLQAWREVLAFRAQAARLRALTEQLRSAIYALDETSEPLRAVLGANPELAALGDREVRELPKSFESATRTARAVERLILDFVHALSLERSRKTR
ncbi:hypothetical protein FHX82_002094 [Amycolatopsis bartoniae]|uniref:Uncharacterized protein n=1 Tax=Amycolatopsis bartoniae TaxID=941986 RepID=A0A8H9J1W6_9PSEU|nr:hypothetical protein [Amycolatopsis bartoniae]MBB2935074.1 hypothetical protein [Amycolatopsis bartoniae]TVT02550.1 hypothetical protein FNH07_27110 [Amycolatopsis bartoniae]GHF74156.1 hypothetical protein GCM10017566_54900 [Amycolatopsis bartoniae]